MMVIRKAIAKDTSALEILFQVTRQSTFCSAARDV